MDASITFHEAYENHDSFLPIRDTFPRLIFCDKDSLVPSFWCTATFIDRHCAFRWHDRTAQAWTRRFQDRGGSKTGRAPWMAFPALLPLLLFSLYPSSSQILDELLHIGLRGGEQY